MADGYASSVVYRALRDERARDREQCQSKEDRGKAEEI